MLLFSEKLNKFYLDSSPLWQNDDSWSGFSWISNDDYKQSVIAFRRIDDDGNELIAVCNFVPVERNDYRIGVPFKGTYKVVFNTDDKEFGGSGIGAKSYKSDDISMHSLDYSIAMTLPPLSVMYLKYTPPRKKAVKKEAPAEETPAAEKTTEEKPKKKRTSAKKKVSQNM
jgi:1,4-alpha-glucan branching enzyme